MRHSAQGVGPRVAHDPGDPLITSHCPFCGSGQVIGRSDGTIGCDFCGQNYIVRVQPAFPGMPQMPSGPGAPSDIGPDGGLVDPGMVGPDGMPPDEGMPPGEGDDGPPSGDDEGDDEAPGPAGGGGSSGTPPPADSKEDSSGKATPKKDKARKKSARVHSPAYPHYRGLQGQALTEDQLVRHLAVSLSGRHPAVLAVLRSEASARRDRLRAAR